ncbi:MAG: BspA family leucine-rich repeat surface protein [Prevotella sp.]|nr:BspA family leucine-rich repeat surface protein [Candidatus Prevotella equi]
MNRIRLQILATLTLLLCVATAKAMSYAYLPTNLNSIMLELSGDYIDDEQNATIEEIEFRTGSFLTPGTLISNEGSPIYAEYNSSRKKITIYTDAQAYMMKNGTYFRYLTSLKSIAGLNMVNTVNMTSMSDMFFGCSSLASLDVSNFNTQNVTDMLGMFYGCSSLASLDVGNFNTQNVIDMSAMFRKCSSLASLDVSNFNTQNVTSMSSMFSGCSSLASLDLSNFNTQNVTYMSSMFYGCSSLASLDVSNFNTQNVTYMYSMFSGCSSLTSLDLSNFNTQNVTSMLDMFDGCSSLASLDVSNFNTQNVTNMSSMFSGCSSLASLDLSNFNTQNVTDMRKMFYNCYSLKSVSVGSTVFTPTNSSLNSKAIVFCPENSISSYENDSFWGRYLIVDRVNSTSDAVLPKRSNLIMRWVADGNLGSQDDFKDTTIEEVRFSTNSYLTPGIKISFGAKPIYIDYNASNNAVTFYTSAPRFVAPEKFIWEKDGWLINGLFNHLSALKGINNLSALDTRNMTDMEYMFNYCSSLASLDVSNFNTQNVKNMFCMFQKCTALTSLDVSNFNTQNVTDIGYVFNGCSALTSIDVTNFNTQNVTLMSGMFNRCSALTSVDVSNFNTQKVSSIMSMFEGCSSLTSLDISNFNIDKITTLWEKSDMFKDCYSLKYLNICPNLTTTGTLHSNAIVTCPENTYETYANDTFWGQYQVVKLKPTVGGAFGDVNNDTDKDVQDLYYVAKGIMAQKDANIFFLPADINQDKKLTAADYVGITNTILGRSYSSAKGASKPEETQYGDDILSATIGDGAMSIALDNMRGYTAMQMDVTLPEGAAIQKSVRGERLTASHNVAVSQLADNKWRVLLTSTQNATMKGFNGELFGLTLNGEDVKAATIDNIQLVEPDMTTQHLNAIEAISDATGVTEVFTETSTEGAVYGLDGVRHNSLKGVKNGIYVSGNKKVMVKQR